MSRMNEQAEWRLMSASDMSGVMAVADIVHPDFFEEEAVFRDRFRVCPGGCFVLVGDNEIVGYAVSHPWQRDSVPELNTVYGGLPENADVYYIHDVALLPQARSGGQASRVVRKIITCASQLKFPAMALVAVNGSQGFWVKQGFAPSNVPKLADKLRTYSEDAVYMIRDS